MVAIELCNFLKQLERKSGILNIDYECKLSALEFGEFAFH